MIRATTTEPVDLASLPYAATAVGPGPLTTVHSPQFTVHRPESRVQSPDIPAVGPHLRPSEPSLTFLDLGLPLSLVTPAHPREEQALSLLVDILRWRPVTSTGPSFYLERLTTRLTDFFEISLHFFACLLACNLESSLFLSGTKLITSLFPRHSSFLFTSYLHHFPSPK